MKRDMTVVMMALLLVCSGCGGGSTSAPMPSAILRSITISPSPVTVAVGIIDTNVQLTATGTYSDGTTQNLTAAANWISDTPSIATVGATTGLATGVSVGVTRISATVGLVTASAAVSVITNSWVSTGDMSTVRVDHTATLLPNGMVLAAGGSDISRVSQASAELYNPEVGTWTLTGSLAKERAHHTATLLPNGTVLVAGGFSGSALATAEIYNPATGSWSATGSMGTTRWFHTATLLPNGTVLVVGGVGAANDTTDLASAEIYDPVTGTWTPTGSMSTARYRHTATLLPNGTVLVSGGDDDSLSGGGPAVASAEIYDPVTGTWSPTGSMLAARYDHTATLLRNGTVVVCGGGAGNGYATVLSSAEIYDSATGTWTATGGMVTARFGHTATLLPNGTVLTAGGGALGSLILSSAEIFDPVTGTWSATGSLVSGRQDYTATLLPNGTVLAAGGAVVPNPTLDPTNLASAEFYDPAAGN